MSERSPISLQIQSYSNSGRSYIFEHDGISGVPYAEGDEVKNGVLVVGGTTRTDTPGLVAIHSHFPQTEYVRDGVSVELIPEKEFKELEEKELIKAHMRDDQY